MMPASWIDRIFDKLSLTYGQAFLARWKDLDLAAVKADWQRELDGMDQHPRAIAYALSHLGDKPPTVIEFRALCRRAPEPEHARLPAPSADPAVVAAGRAKLAAIRADIMQARQAGQPVSAGVAAAAGAASSVLASAGDAT